MKQIVKLLSYICQLIKSAEEFVEEADQLLRTALRCENSKAHNIREQDAKTNFYIYICFINNIKNYVKQFI